MVARKKPIAVIKGLASITQMKQKTQSINQLCFICETCIKSKAENKQTPKQKRKFTPETLKWLKVCESNATEQVKTGKKTIIKQNK